MMILLRHLACDAYPGPGAVTGRDPEPAWRAAPLAHRPGPSITTTVFYFKEIDRRTL